MNIVALVFIIFSFSAVDPVEEVAAIKLGRRADGEIFIMEWYKPKYFSDTCEVYEAFMPYVLDRCFKEEKKDRKKSERTKTTLKL